MPDVSGLSLPEEAVEAAAEWLAGLGERHPSDSDREYARSFLDAVLPELPAEWLLARALTKDELGALDLVLGKIELRGPAGEVKCEALEDARSKLRSAAALQGGGSGV